MQHICYLRVGRKSAYSSCRLGSINLYERNTQYLDPHVNTGGIVRSLVLTGVKNKEYAGSPSNEYVGVLWSVTHRRNEVDTIQLSGSSLLLFNISM